MEITPSGPEADDTPEPSDTARAEPSWLLGFVRADVLALTGIVAAGAAVFGLPVVDLAFSVYAYSPDVPSKAWTYVPILVAAGIALIAGMSGLYRAGVEASAGWVRALAGSAALIGLIMMITTVIVWNLAPDAEPFPEEFAELGGFWSEPMSRQPTDLPLGPTD